jgi:hypothetical protein
MSNGQSLRRDFFTSANSLSFPSILYVYGLRQNASDKTHERHSYVA